MCFSELTPGSFGPRRVTQAEIRSAFANGWAVHEITAALFEGTVKDRQPRAWRAVIERTG